MLDKREDDRLDLKVVKCPINFVKIKLKLEEYNTPQKLGA